MSRRQTMSPTARTPTKKDRSSMGEAGLKAAEENYTNIRVLCRFRPMKTKDGGKVDEKQSTKLECFDFDIENSQVNVVDTFEKKMFTYDRMLSIDSNQSDVFEYVKTSVESIMDGFNATVLSYGQTSSGKTWTMEGPDLNDNDLQGVIPRAIRRLFALIGAANKSTTFTVCVSYFEVYCEKLRDLLNPNQDNMKIRESKDSGYSIQDLSEVFCASVNDVLHVINSGKANRASAPTLMNAESSRSHSILTILVTQKNEAKGINMKGKLYLVDLAGSEKVKKTGAVGTRLDEAKNINKSLTTLGMVINGLVDGSQHINFRDSKLTRILMDSLGGNSKTTLIINCAPEPRHLAETLSTLRFGDRAKNIKNKVKVNEELGVGELTKLLELARREIDELKKTSAAADSITTAGNSGGEDVSTLPPSLPSSDSTSSNLDSADGGAEESTKAAAAATIVALQQQVEELEFKNKELMEQLDDEVKSGESAAEEASNQIIELKEQLAEIKMSEEGLKEQVLKLSLEKNEAFQAIPAPVEIPVLDVEEIDDEEEEKTIDSNDNGLQVEEDIATKDQKINKKSQHRDDHDDEEEDENEDDDGNDSGFEEEESSKSIPLDSNISDLHEAGGGASLDQLQQESAQLLKGIDEAEMEGVNDDNNSDTGGTSSRGRFVSGFAKLKHDYDTHVRRLLAKLAAEQMTRSNLEDEIDTMNQKSQGSPGKGGWMRNMFGGGGNKFNSTRVTKQERALKETVFDLSNKLANSERLYETTKESHRIVLETKESVVRSLLKQNTEISFERDSLNARVESLTSALDHLTGLLRNLQNSSMTGTGASGGLHSNKVVTIGGNAEADDDVNGNISDGLQKVVISGGGNAEDVS